MSGKRRILVVDDEPSIRMLVRTVLERAGYDVTTARDGVEAITLLAASDYDLVLLDVVMPNLGGLAVVDALRKNSLGVLAHTYLLTGGDSEDLASLPVRGVIAKPFDISSLLAEAKDCIGH
ncbi:MAG TPA: response regulator [Thermoanaerobaculia bacterium]|jgi:CheY-like chemotaxis protein